MLELYLFAGLLQKTIVLCRPPNHKGQEVVHIAVILGIGNTLRLERHQALKGMYNFLHQFPGNAGHFAHLPVTIDNLINLFVLLNEGEYEPM